ncbi:MAG: hypothetical protein AB4080_23400 [Trichodesmium sp.]
MPQVSLLPGAIEEMLVSVAYSGYITELDRYGLMAAILDNSLTREERSILDRLLRFVIKGRIKVEE